MDYVISHDFSAELAAAIKLIDEKRGGIETRAGTSPFFVHTRYNCEAVAVSFGTQARPACSSEAMLAIDVSC